MSQRAIEVKVGILILFALAILMGFVVVMGGMTFESTYTVYVDFENPGGLQNGAPVRLAGMKIGKVDQMEFRGGELAQSGTDHVPPIRVAAKIEKRYQPSIAKKSRFLVTTQGVLGEAYLAVEPGPPGDLLEDGAIVHGISPPRIDVLLSEMSDLLHRTHVAIANNQEKIGETFDGLHATLTGTGKLFGKNGEQLERIITNVEKITVTADETLVAARQKYVDNPQIDRIMGNVERTTATLDTKLSPLLTDSREMVGEIRRFTAVVATEEQGQRLAQITTDLSEITATTKRFTKEAEGLVNHVKEGRGTLGAIVMDEALYDDVQEMLRDLKHNPWKFFWRE